MHFACWKELNLLHALIRNPEEPVSESVWLLSARLDQAYCQGMIDERLANYAKLTISPIY